jgi:hypothetical protein
MNHSRAIIIGAIISTVATALSVFVAVFFLHVLAAHPASATAYTKDVPAGPIWSNAEAPGICPGVCAHAGGRWTGAWVTTIPGEMSVCGCAFKL